MHILGIDPGTGRTGWGVIKILNIKNKQSFSSNKQSLSSNKKSLISSLLENREVNGNDKVEYMAHGCIITQKDDSMPQRLFILHNEMKKIIAQFKPKNIVIESIFFGRNSKTAISVGQAKGVIMLAAYDIPVFEYTGISVKHFLSGHGRTEKKEMQKIVRRILNKNRRKLSFNTKDRGFDDAADALAIALFHVLKS